MPNGARRWSWVLNNPEDTPTPTTTSRINYVVWQLEAGQEGTPHWQGFLECKKSTMAQLKTVPWLARAHLEVVCSVVVWSCDIVCVMCVLSLIEKTINFFNA